MNSARRSWEANVSTKFWYIAPAIDSIALTVATMSRAGLSLGGTSVASLPLMAVKIGGTTRFMYQELAHSYGSAPAAVVSLASASAAAWWSLTRRSTSCWSDGSSAPLVVIVP